MTAEITIAMAQANPTVGDLEGNLALARRLRAQTAAAGADLVLFSELLLVGYPPEDLVLKPALCAQARLALDELALDTADGGPAMVVGAPWREPDGAVYNAALLLHGGAIAGRMFKHVLPNHGVFDDQRLFAAGPVPGPLRLPLAAGGAIRLGVMVGADMWSEDVAEGLSESGAQLLVVLGGAPFEPDRADRRLQLAVARVTETGLPLLHVNQVGGQDELVFDGGSFALDAERRLVAQAPTFVEALALTTWRCGPDEVWRPTARGAIAAPRPELESIWRAMVVGLRDHVGKNRFPGVVLGLSGGIDSALSAVVAVDALGPERVRAVTMPSRHTAQGSLEDAAECARRLGIRLDQVPIEPAVAACRQLLAPLLGERAPDTAEANLQARIRAVILLGIADRLGPLVLATSNKSELAVGCGELGGGYSVLKDLYQTAVLELARWRNAHRPEGSLGPAGAPIPERIITGPPTTEPRADQRDEDALPPYPVLDQLLAGLVEQDLAPHELAARGFDPDTVRRIADLLDRAEPQRRQAPPGVKLTRKAFGRDRRYPLTNAFGRLGPGDLPPEG